MTIEERLAGKNTDEIGSIMVELSKELLTVNEGLSIKKKEKHLIDIKRHDLEGQIKNLAIVIDDLRDKRNRILIELQICKDTYLSRK